MMKKIKTFGISLLVAACAVCLSLAFVACKGGEDKATYGMGEEGFYYCDASDSTRYMLSLQSGNYMITVNNETQYSGSYSYDEEAGEISFSGDTAFTAAVGENALSLDMGDSGYSFKAYKYFDVTYVDENGKVVATESVLNGQPAEALEIEKDGYWFVGWYEDESNSSEFAFDTSIAGNTTVYGWYIEKNPQATEYEITLDYGEGVTETVSTMNGAVWKLPKAYEGADILGWWVSATNKSGELTYRYGIGTAFTADTALFAVYSGSGVLGASVTADGVTWDSSNAGQNVSVYVYNAAGEQIIFGSAPSTSGIFTSQNFSSLTSGTYTVVAESGGIREELVYVVNGLPRVSMSSACIISNGDGRLISFSPVEGATGYEITVTNGERTVTEDLGAKTYYNFSGWEMTAEGISFTVRAYADGEVDSVSDTYTYFLGLGKTSVGSDGDSIVWTSVEGAIGYEVSLTDVDGNVIDAFTTAETSFSMKYYESGTYDIFVRPVTEGYYSEWSSYRGYAKTALRAPTITSVTSSYVSWENVEGAVSYVVMIDGKTYPVENGETLYFTDLPSGGSFEICVMAVSADGNDSPYSDPVTVTSEAFSSALRYENGAIYWNYDVAASRYVVSVNGATKEVVGTNSAAVTLNKTGDNVITVTAYGSDGETLGTASVTVYAYAVTLDPNGAKFPDESEDTGFMYVAQGDVLNLGYVEKDNAHFVGWYTQPDYTNGQSDEYEGKGSLVADGSVFTSGRDVYLYAYWSYDYSDVELVIGGGVLYGVTGGSVTVKIKYCSETFDLGAPVPNAAENGFIGWYSGVNGGGDRYTESDGISIKSYDGATTLYANYLAVLKFESSKYGVESVYSVSAGAYIGSVSTLTIPETYEGKRLVINSGAFANCGTLKTVNIPDTVAYVAMTYNGYMSGSGAFSGCANLQNVNVYVTGDSPDSTKEVNYYSAGGVLFHKTGEGEAEILYYPHGRAEVSSYAIPSIVSNEYECDAFGAAVVCRVTTIPRQVFRDKKIKEIIIPSTVTLVETQAFYYNLNLTTVTFTMGGSDPLTIEDDAFYKCLKLTSVTLPARYEDFNSGAYVGCSALSNIYIEAGGIYTSQDGLLLADGGNTLVWYPLGRGGDVNLGNLGTILVTRIGDGAFISNTKLTRVVIPSYITYIGEKAFESCTALSEVVFEGTENSGNLTIKTRAFYGCSALKRIDLPANLTVLEADAFAACYGLTYVYFDARTGTDSSSLNFASGAFGTSYITTLELGVNVPEFDFVSVFCGTLIEKVIIAEGNDNYMSDEAGAVYNGNGTVILYYPAARKGAYTEMLDTVTNISASVFANNANITSIEIGAGVNTIAFGAFSSCPNLTAITVRCGNSNFGASDGVLYAKEGDSLVELVYCPLACAVTTLEVGEQVTKVSEYAFAGNAAVTSVEFKASELKLGMYAFRGATSLEKVTLPNSMAEIPDYAFCECSNLSSVNIPTSCERIGEYAFYLCTKLVGDLYAATQTTGTYVALPEGLKTVGKYAFAGGNADTTTKTMYLAVTIPSTVEKIDDYAFYGCWDNTTYGKYGIVFASCGEGESPVELTIGDYAFAYARCSTGVEIPARVVSLGEGAFYYLGSNLNSGGLVVGPLDSGIQTFPKIGGETEDTTADVEIQFEDGTKLTKIPDLAFKNAGITKDVTIPASVEEIGAEAFYSSGITGVAFGNEEDTVNLRIIGNGAFYGLTGTVTIPASVVAIGSDAFKCARSGITSVTFEENGALREIGSGAFEYTSLTEVSIPATVETIGSGAFYGCSSLATVTFAAGCGIGELSEQLFYNCTQLAAIEVPESVTKIGKNAFAGCTALTSVTFGTDGSSLERIDDYAFKGCTGLTSFAFPESAASEISLGFGIFSGSGLTTLTLSSGVKNLGDALNGCTTLANFVTTGNAYYSFTDGILYDAGGAVVYVPTNKYTGEVTIPETVTEIGSGAYQNQTGLTEITIPASVKTIGDYAFAGCTALTKVTFAEGTSLSGFGEHVFEGCEALATINLPEGTTEIPAYTFYGCTALAEISIPSSVTVIGSYAFYSSGIESTPGQNFLDLSGITTVGEYAFMTCDSLVEVRFDDMLVTMGAYAFSECAELATVELGHSLARVPDYAFNKTELAAIEIPGSVTEIGKDAFWYTKSLTEVTLNEGLITIGYEAFYASTVSSVNLPSTLKTIDYRGFCSTNLTEVTLPEGLTQLGNYAFQSTKITEIELGGALDSVGILAFHGCASLETVTVLTEISSIGQECFENCTSLTTINLGSAVKTIGMYMFSGCTALETVEFGSSVKTIGSNAFKNCTSLKSVTLSRGLESIGQNAFNGCTGLEYIVIPATVTSVGASAFTGCTCDLYIENSEGNVGIAWASGWDTGFTGEVYYHSDYEPELNDEGTAYDGNYWHYDSKDEIVIWIYTPAASDED